MPAADFLGLVQATAGNRAALEVVRRSEGERSVATVGLPPMPIREHLSRGVQRQPTVTAEFDGVGIVYDLAVDAQATQLRKAILADLDEVGQELERAVPGRVVRFQRQHDITNIYDLRFELAIAVAASDGPLRNTCQQLLDLVELVVKARDKLDTYRPVAELEDEDSGPSWDEETAAKGKTKISGVGQ